MHVVCNGYDLDGTSTAAPFTREKRKNCSVLYLGHGTRKRAKIVRAEIMRLQPETIYINTIFSFELTLLPLLINSRGKYQPKNIIIAPRGALKHSAFRLKSSKKTIFIWILRHFIAASNVKFQFTTVEEQKESTALLGTSDKKTVCVANVPVPPAPAPVNVTKQPDNLRILFIGRIHPIKNPDYLLRSLALVDAKAKITADFYGYIDDEKYYNETCLPVAAALPERIKIKFHGAADYPSVAKAIARAHVIVQPSDTENFGHAMFEALGQGRPVITSFFTPWQNLSNINAGYNIDIQNLLECAEALNCLALADQCTYDKTASAAWQLACDYFNKQRYEVSYRRLFSGHEHGI